MGMGYAANHADVIEKETLAKMFPKEYASLLSAINAEGETLEGYAGEIQNGENADILGVAVRDAYKALRKAFSRKFKGLDLCLLFHDQENEGDRYDGVSGAFWHVDGLWIHSPGAKKLGEKHWKRKFYVTFG